MGKILDWVGKWIAVVSMAVARVLLGFIAFILLLQVILRYVFNAALSWPEEAARYGIIWAVLLVGNILIRERELIKVDFFDQLWPVNFIKWRDSVYRVILLFLLWILFKEGIDQAIYGLKTTTTALEIKRFWPYLAVPVGAFFMIIQMVYIIQRDFKSSRGKDG